jgi:hypothetical protein
MDLTAAAWAEIEIRHHFFVEWFTGRADGAAMEASARAFAPDMAMIGPSGGLAGADQVIEMLRAARGRRGPDFTIRVELVAARLLAPDLVQIIYDEHQAHAGETSARRSTALFSPNDAAPEGVVWRSLHETWIKTD